MRRSHGPPRHGHRSRDGQPLPPQARRRPGTSASRSPEEAAVLHQPRPASEARRARRRLQRADGDVRVVARSHRGRVQGGRVPGSLCDGDSAGCSSAGGGLREPKQAGFGRCSSRRQPSVENYPPFVSPPRAERRPRRISPSVARGRATTLSSALARLCCAPTSATMISGARGRTPFVTRTFVCHGLPWPSVGRSCATSRRAQRLQDLPSVRVGGVAFVLVLLAFAACESNSDSIADSPDGSNPPSACPPEGLCSGSLTCSAPIGPNCAIFCGCTAEFEWGCVVGCASPQCPNERPQSGDGCPIGLTCEYQDGCMSSTCACPEPFEWGAPVQWQCSSTISCADASADVDAHQAHDADAADVLELPQDSLAE